MGESFSRFAIVPNTKARPMPMTIIAMSGVSVMAQVSLVRQHRARGVIAASSRRFLCRKQPLYRGRHAEELAILAVARDQHQTHGKPSFLGQRQRDRAKVE